MQNKTCLAFVLKEITVRHLEEPSQVALFVFFLLAFTQCIHTQALMLLAHKSNLQYKLKIKIYAHKRFLVLAIPQSTYTPGPADLLNILAKVCPWVNREDAISLGLYMLVCFL